MKREAYRHPKMYDLASRLGVSLPTAIGTIQLLWNYTADVAPQGDIGKWPDGAISRGCEWQGNASEFVTALVESGWLDKCPVHRLLIHDLADHAESWWKMKVQKLNLPFFSLAEGTSEAKVASAEGTSEAKVASAEGTSEAKVASPPRDPTSPLLSSPKPKKARARFQKPTVEQVRGYCHERRNSIDPEEFVDFYESKGWMIGTGPMHDWKACVRTWEKKTDRKKPASTGRTTDGIKAEMDRRRAESAALDAQLAAERNEKESA